MVKTVGKSVGNGVSTGKLIRVVVSFTDKGKVKIVKSKGNIEGFTDKNVKVGENNGDFKRLVNIDLLGEFQNYENKVFTKWFIANNENETKSEIREMMLEVGRILRAEESKLLENLNEMKRSVRAEGMKYIIEKEKNPGERRGRPKGAKNKSSIVGNEIIEDEKVEKESKGRVGRPKGSKNKETGEEFEKESKGRVGRPKGSKNKVTGEEEVKKETKGRVGRPKGSKNKITDEEEVKEVKKETKGRVGRPKGSKNKVDGDSGNIVEFKPESKGRVGRPKGSKNKTSVNDILDIDDEDSVSTSKAQTERIVENVSKMQNGKKVKADEIVSGADVFEAKQKINQKTAVRQSSKTKEKPVFSKNDLKNTPFVEA